MAGETTVIILLCGGFSLWVTEQYERAGGFQLGSIASGELGAKFRAGFANFCVYLFGFISVISNLALSNYGVLFVDMALLTGFFVARRRIKSNVDIDKKAKEKRLSKIRKRQERAAERWQSTIDGTFAALDTAADLFESVDQYVPDTDYDDVDRTDRTRRTDNTSNTRRSTSRSGRSRSDSVADSVDIEGKVNPMAVRSTAARVAGDHPSGGGGSFSYQQAAEIHRYVNENISYVPDPAGDNYIAPPDETLTTGAGDCDCQAVLVASMLEAIGATTRIVFCSAPDGAHALSEVRLASSTSETREVSDALGSYYTSYGNFAYEPGSDGVWYPADTAMGRYIGDIGQLSDNGYVQQASDGSWSWYDVEYYYP